MSRRGGPGLQVLIGVVVVGLFLYGFYSYHEVQSRLRTMEEKADRFKVEHESVAAQLQVVYEHKSRLEKTVQEERTMHKKTKDDLDEKHVLEQKMRQEKDILSQEVDRMKSERDRYEDQRNKLEGEKQHTEEELKTLRDSCEKQNESHLQQISQQRQECDNDVAQLKDEIADLKRRNADLEARVPNQSGGLKLGSADAAGKNKSMIDDNRQNMQIAEPGDNKPKAYFEVKSPAPVDKKLVDAQQQQQQQQQNEQVAPPVVKDTETGDDDNAGANANRDQNDDDNRIKDIPAVKQSEDRHLGAVKNPDQNVIDPIPADHVVKEPPQEERNAVPGHIPPPASNDENQPAAGIDKLKENEIPDQVANPNEAAKPGEDHLPGQANPPGDGVGKPPGKERHVAKIPDEDDVEEDEQAGNEAQQGNADAKKIAEKEQEDEYEENQEDNVKDM